MINKQNFNEIRKEIEEFDDRRDEIIKKSRDITRTSKHVIYCVHRNEIKEAEALLKEAKTCIDSVRKMIEKNNKLATLPSFSSAMQEYCEAIAYYGFVKNKKIPSNSEIKADPEDYLMGLCDLTGELGRRAVNLTIKKQYKEVVQIRELVDDMYGEFIKLNLRNSELRKKFDSIKWNLKKIEDVVYDIKTKR